MILLLGCATPPASPPPALTTVDDAWTAATIDQLVPRAPSHHVRLPPLDLGATALATLERTSVAASRAHADAPWVLAHLLLADPTASLGPLGPAVVPATLAGRAWPSFPRTPEGDAHTDLVLKNVMERGLGPDTPVGAYTLAQLFRYAVLETELDPDRKLSSFTSPDDMPWTVQALAMGAPESGLRWVTEDGTRMDVAALGAFVVSVLDRESRFLVEAKAKGQPFARNGERLFQFTCGGAHLLQGAAYATVEGFGGKDGVAVMKVQADLLPWRMVGEAQLLEKTIAAHPEVELQLRVQELKALGHGLESYGKLEAMGFLTPDVSVLTTAAAALDADVARLDALGAWASLDTLATSDPQLYRDLLGDGDHAVRGLRIVRGEDTVDW